MMGRTNVNEVVNSSLVVDAVYSVLVELIYWLGMFLLTLYLVSKSVCVMKSMAKGSLQNSAFSYLNFHSYSNHK